MPNPSGLVDERVVQMRMDNDDFEKGAAKTMSTLDKLKESLNFKGVKNDIGDLGLSTIEKSLDKIAEKFNARQIAWKRGIENLMDSAFDLAKNAITGADQITPGYGKYEQQINAIQKLMVATGESMEAVQEMSDKILWFTDETSYNYSSMLDTMSSFTSSGMGIKDAMDTILGLAVAAGQSGVNAQNASHAFMGFQRAIGKGYMDSRSWQWIQTTGMNAAELKQVLLDAAVATGDLEKGQNGLYYALEETKKGVKKTEISVQNFDQSFASKWLTDEAIIKGMQKYVKAVNQIYDIHQDTKKQMYEIVDENSEYLKQIDEYSLAAFQAGQETKTWSDAMEAIKSSVSSGWMKSFELIIGNYKQAAGFFSDLIEPLFTIFVGPGERRNNLLELIFGGGEDSGERTRSFKNTVANWEKIEKKLKESGHSMEEFEEAYANFVVKQNRTDLVGLIENYGSLEAAIRAGVITGEDLQQILNEIAGVAAATSEEEVRSYEDATTALEKYKEVASDVLKGTYGNGDERRKALEEMGYNYEMIQWLAGNMQAYGDFDWDWIKEVAPNHYERFMEIIGDGNKILDTATGEWIVLEDVVDSTVDEVADKMAGMSGRQLWQEGVLNLVKGVASVFDEISGAIDDVFGTVEERAKGFRGLLEKFYRATTKFNPELEENAEGLSKVRTVAAEIFEFIKKVPERVGKIWRILRNFYSGGLVLLDKLLSLLSRNTDTEHQFGSLASVLSKIKDLLGPIWDFAKKIFDILSGDMSGIFKKIEEFSFSDLFQGRSLEWITTKISDLFGERGILSGAVRLLERFTKAGDDASRSIQGIDESTRNMIGFWDDPETILTDAANGISEGSMREKLGKLFDRFKKVIGDEYGNIHWDTILQAGKLGLTGFLLYRVNDFFSSLDGIAKIGTSFTQRITEPFTAMAEAIEEKNRATNVVKVATAIAILAGSIWLLAQVPADDFYNVALTLGLLMLLLSQITNNLQGAQIFSNNTKQTAGAVQRTITAFDKMKGIFDFDFTNARFKVNVFNGIAQILVGVAAAIAAIGYAFSQIKDVQSLEQVEPALIIIGGIMASLLIFTGLVSAFTAKSKYIGKAGWLIAAFAIAITLLTNTLIKVASLDFSKINTTAMDMAFMGIIILLGSFAGVLLAASKMVKQTKKTASNSRAILALAGVVLSIGIMLRSAVKSIRIASGIKDWTNGLAIVASILIALAVILTIMTAITDHNPKTGGSMLKVAASMMILAFAILTLVPAILLLSVMPASGVLAAAAAISLLIVAIGGAMALMSKISGKKMIAIASAFGLVALGLGVIVAAALAFNVAMIAMVANVKWDKLKKNFKTLYSWVKKSWVQLLLLSAVVLLCGIGILAFGAGVVLAAAGFAASALGIYLIAKALDVFSGSLDKLGTGLPKFIDGLIEMYDKVDGNGWKVIVTLAALAGAALLAIKLIKSIDFSKLSEKDNNGTYKFISSFMGIFDALIQLIKLATPKVVSAVLEILPKITTALLLLLPLMSDTLVDILIGLINGVSDSIRKNSDAIVDAFGNLLDALWKLLLKAFEKLIIGAAKAGDYAAKALFSLLFPEIPEEEIQAVDTFHIGFRSAGYDADLREQAYKDGKRSAEMQAEGFAEGVSDAVGYSDSYAALLKKYGVDLNASQDEQIRSIFGDEYYGMEAGKGVGGNIVKGVAEEITSEDSKSTLAKGINEVVGSMFADAGDADKILKENGLDAGSIGYGSVLKESMKGSLIDVFGSVFDDAGFIGSLTGNGESSGQTLLNGLTGWLSGDESKEQMGGAAQNIFGFFGNSFDTEAGKSEPNGVAGIAENTILGLVNKIKEKASRLLPGAGAYAFSQVKSGYDAAGQINSPSKEMEDQGEWTIIGLANGLLKYAYLATEAGEDVGNGVIDAASRAMSTAIALNLDGTGTQSVTPVVDWSSANTEDAGLHMSIGDYNSEMQRWQALASTQNNALAAQENEMTRQAREEAENIRSLWDEYAVRTTELSNTVETSLDNSGMAAQVDNLAVKVDELGNKIANMQIVLDSGVLVGATTAKYDRSLGLLATRKGRGN